MLDVVRRVDQMQHDIGVADGFPCALDADAFHFVGGIVAQTCGVDNVQRDAVYLDRLAHAIARGAGNWRDDGEIRAGERIEQRGLAHIGLSGQNHRQSFTQQ